MRSSSIRQRPMCGGPLPCWCSLAIGASLVIGCGDFVSIEAFEEIPPLAHLDYETVHPAVPYDYWELRESLPTGAHTPIGSGGIRRKGEIASDVRITFDTTTAGAGFAPFCPPGDCFRYFATLLGRTVTTWEDAQRASELLGTIDTSTEAALLALASGYHWGPTKEEGAMRPVADGYELVVLKTVSYCHPVETHRFLLRIPVSDPITILKSEIWHTERGCI